MVANGPRGWIGSGPCSSLQAHQAGAVKAGLCPHGLVHPAAKIQGERGNKLVVSQVAIAMCSGSWVQKQRGKFQGLFFPLMPEGNQKMREGIAVCPRLSTEQGGSIAADFSSGCAMARAQHGAVPGPGLKQSCSPQCNHRALTLLPPCVPAGPNCFAGTTIIPAGIEVKVDDCNICHCHNGDWWKPAQCSKRECQGKQAL